MACLGATFRIGKTWEFWGSWYNPWAFHHGDRRWNGLSWILLVGSVRWHFSCMPMLSGVRDLRLAQLNCPSFHVCSVVIGLCVSLVSCELNARSSCPPRTTPLAPYPLPLIPRPSPPDSPPPWSRMLRSHLISSPRSSLLRVLAAPATVIL